MHYTFLLDVKKIHLRNSRALIHYPVLCSALHLNSIHFHLSDSLTEHENLLISERDLCKGDSTIMYRRYCLKPTSLYPRP